jgi:hypothetical protein
MVERGGRVVTTLLVERYCPASIRLSLPELIVDRYATDGAGVTHLGSILVPTDETLFSLFEAVSLEALRDAHERAQAEFERIVECTSTFSTQPTETKREGDE